MEVLEVLCGAESGSSALLHAVLVKLQRAEERAERVLENQRTAEERAERVLEKQRTAEVEPCSHCNCEYPGMHSTYSLLQTYY